MNYNRKIMRLELSAEKALNGGYYYAELLLPAADYEIKDAMQRTRAAGRENTVEVSILECDILPELQDIRLDTFSLDELNFFAKRLVSLTDEEMPVFYAVTDEVFRAADNDGLVSIKDLINCTYGLDTVPVAHNVSNLAELGRFTFENELLSDLEGIPESAVPFLNAEQIGRVQQKNDSGVFEGRLYIPTVHYDRPEIYDGVTLPDEESESSDFVIRLLVSGTPEHIKGDPADRAIWLSLPMASDILANYAAAFNEAEIGDCVYYDFESVIPQITSEMFGSMSDVQTLNKLAAEISIMSESEQVKFKAVLDAEFQKMLKAVSADNADGIDEERITELMNEKQRLTVQLEQYAAVRQKRESAKSRLDEIFTILDGLQNHPMEYDDKLVRQIIECIVVESKEKIKVVFIGGTEIEMTL